MHYEVIDFILWTGWHEIKTGQENEISYHPDRISFEMDSIHGFGSYIVTQGDMLQSGENEKDWLYPDFYKLESGGAASKASRIIKGLVDEIPNLEKDHASHGLRAGSADELAMNESVDVVSIISRGNW